MIELRGTGIILRPPRPSEAAAALALLTEPEVDRWNPASDVVDLETAEAWCRRGADWAAGTHATFSILVDPGGAYAGNVSLHNVDPEHLTADIGYRVAADHRGRGIATEALRLVASYAFGDRGLFRVQLLHAVANPASCRVAEKAGFRLEGTLRAAAVHAGHREDEHLHARLRTDP
ncbi:MAG TPA: GNAT family protein [Acidimicrobiales bacterium]|nr:GNAT family protein [Acidimicrobiales bacterium]